MRGSSQGSGYPGHSSRSPSCVSQKHSLTCTEADPSWACREREIAASQQRFHDGRTRVFNADPPPPVRTRTRPERVKRAAAAAAGEVPRYRCARSAPAAVRTARRQWIEHAGHTPAPTPMWTSRQGWLDELSAWLANAEGLAECRRLHIKAALALRVATVLAAHADHATGRNCAISNATAAQGATDRPDGTGCSERTVTTVRSLLRASGLGVEAHRGTGSASTPGFRRPSIWHLISRRSPADHHAAAQAVCDLPPSLRDRRLSLEKNSLPNARQRAPQPQSAPRRRAPSRRTLRAPRPLGIQRLADELVGNRYGRAPLCHGLGRGGHIGAICDALMAAGARVVRHRENRGKGAARW